MKKDLLALVVQVDLVHPPVADQFLLSGQWEAAAVEHAHHFMVRVILLAILQKVPTVIYHHFNQNPQDNQFAFHT